MVGMKLAATEHVGSKAACLVSAVELSQQHNAHNLVTLLLGSGQCLLAGANGFVPEPGLFGPSALVAQRQGLCPSGPPPHPAPCHVARVGLASQRHPSPAA